MWNREKSEDVPVEESPLTAARRNALQRQATQRTEPRIRRFWYFWLLLLAFEVMMQNLSQQ